MSTHQIQHQKRLIFFWVKKYKVLKNFGMCLVNDYRIDYDESMLKIEKKKNYPNVLQNLKNIAAVVGKNGTGKSTCLEFLDEALCGEIQSNFFMVFETEVKSGIELEIFAPDYTALKEQEHKIDIDKLLKVTITEQPHDLSEHDVGLIRAASFHTSDVVYPAAVPEQHFSRRRCEIRTSTLTSSDEKQVISTLYHLQNIIEHMKDYDFGFTAETIKLNYYDYYFGVDEKLSKLGMEASKEEIYSQFLPNPYDGELLNNPDIYDEYINRFESKYSKDIMDIGLSITLDVYDQIIRSSNGVNTVTSAIFTILLVSSHEYVDEHLLDIKDRILSDHEITDKQFEAVLKLYRFLQSLLELLNDHKEAIKKNVEVGKLELSFSKKDISKISVFIDELLELEKQYSIFNISSIIRPRWSGISSGQLHMMKLLVGLIELRLAKRIQSSATVIIILDEVETSFHPEWQRLFITILIACIDKLCGFSMKDVQIIIGTHSPYILSDILNENCRYLYRSLEGGGFESQMGGSQKSSFAGNIHELLRDSFFMDSTVGGYAEQIIRGLESFFTPIDNEEIAREKIHINTIEEASFLIDQISDKFLKNYFSKELLRKSAEKSNVKNEIERLEKEGDIKKLVSFLRENNIV